MCTLIMSKATDIDENIANQNHATRTRAPKPGYLNLSSFTFLTGLAVLMESAFNVLPICYIYFSTMGTQACGRMKIREHFTKI
jgi:uncharacterized membrane protein